MAEVTSELQDNKKTMFQTPVVTSLKPEQFKRTTDFMARCRSGGIEIALAENTRLRDYFNEGFYEQLRKDLANRKLITGSELLKILDRGILQKSFSRMADRTGSTLLSEFLITPLSTLETMGKSEDNTSFVKLAKYGDTYIAFGFVQVFGKSGNKNATSLSVIGLDDQIVPFIPQSEKLYRALQVVATAGNHDMQHHLTSETITSSVTRTSVRDGYTKASNVLEWYSNYNFRNADSDKDITSYESFVLLNHARVWRELEDKNSSEWQKLEAACDTVLDELAKIAKNVAPGAEPGDLSWNQVKALDYVGTVLCTCLMRFLPLDHALFNKILTRMEQIDPAAASYKDRRDALVNRIEVMKDLGYRGAESDHGYFTQTIQNYGRKGSFDLLKSLNNNGNDANYADFKRLEIAAISPEITLLLSPASTGSKLADIQERTAQMNIDMMQAVALDTGLYPAGEPVVTTTRDGGQITSYYNSFGQLHRKGGPAYVKIEPNGRRVEKYFEEGVLCREGAPAHIETGSEERVEIWSSSIGYHRTDGPALTRISKNGARREEYYVNGIKHREGAPADISITAKGDRVERWFLNGTLYNPNGTALKALYADGTRLEEWKDRNGLPILKSEQRLGSTITRTWMQDYHEIGIIKIKPDGKIEEAWDEDKPELCAEMKAMEAHFRKYGNIEPAKIIEFKISTKKAKMKKVEKEALAQIKKRQSLKT